MSIFHSNIINIYGEKGKTWIDELPAFVVKISSELGLDSEGLAGISIATEAFRSLKSAGQKYNNLL